MGIPHEYNEYGTLSMKTDLEQFAQRICGVIVKVSNTERWEGLIHLVCKKFTYKSVDHQLFYVLLMSAINTRFENYL
jgi:hypothetical protein